MNAHLPLLCTALALASACFGLDRPEQTFKVYQFGRDQIPRIDGDASDWAMVPEPYVIGTKLLTDDDKKHPAPDPKTLDVRVKVGWVKGLNRLYVLYEASDDRWEFDTPTLHNDTFELMVDGDASGGSMGSKDLKRFFTPEEVGVVTAQPDERISDAMARWVSHSVHAQNYHIFTPSKGKPWAMLWGAPTWVKDFPFANAAEHYDFKPGEGGRYTLEFWITPFDYAGAEGPERSVESKLWEDKIIGLSWAILDYDSATDRKDGVWRLSSHRFSFIHASRLCAFRLMPREPEQITKPRADWSWKIIDMEKRTVAFHDESEGPVDSWKWSFGDGATSTERNPVHSFEKSTPPQVVLETSGPKGSARMAKPLEISFR